MLEGYLVLPYSEVMNSLLTHRSIGDAGIYFKVSPECDKVLSQRIPISSSTRSEMKNVFVVSPSDLAKLRQVLASRLGGEQVTCSSLHEIEAVKEAESVYFVISETSMCSTAYQELVFACLEAVGTSNLIVFRLDNAEIPLGFSVLNSLPQRNPV